MTKETNYEDMSVEELKKLKEQREKEAYVKTLKEQDAEQKRVELEKHDKEVADKAIESYLKANPPAPKINTQEPENTQANSDVNEYGAYFNKLIKKSGYKYQDYEDISINMPAEEYTDSDSGCDTDVSGWSPADTFVNAVWHSMYCKADLMKIAVPGLEINKGDGLTVQIRTIGKFGAPTEADACECVSCDNNTLSTYSLTLKQYGMVTEICEKDVWDVGEVYRSKMIEALGLRWAEFFDATIYSELETASPGTTETLANALSCTPGMSGSCCTDTSLVDFYNAVNEILASMREGTAPYDPDYMIISPSVASILKRMQEATVQPWASSIVQLDSNGRVSSFNGLKVIEYCGA
ncbi:MAG: hypothetical protein ACOC80_13805, partial [Petrotogales bacterium]